VRQSIFGNVGTLVSFRVGHHDADWLEHEFGDEFLAKQFVDLAAYEVFVRLHEDARPLPAFRATTCPPLDFGKGRREKLVARSRERFASRRDEVEDRLTKWMAPRAFGFGA
jgi:hypothetical protein